MAFRERLRPLRQSAPVRLGLLVLGCLLMLSAAFVGPIPGPGGIIVFAAGLGLALRNSLWAKRNYVRFKRWQPKAGSWADWGLRRASPRRRAEMAKKAGMPHND